MSATTPSRVPGAYEASGRWTTVVMLMTDIVGSTSHWEEDEMAMSAALRWHDHLVRDAVVAAGGRLLKGHCGGDGTLAVFRTVDGAVEAALNLQRAIAMTAWPTSRPLQLRTAVHLGRVERRDRDVFGTEVNRCARLCDSAAGGQVLVSEAAAGALVRGWRVVPRGTRLLRGLTGRTVTFEVMHSAAARAEVSWCRPAAAAH